MLKLAGTDDTDKTTSGFYKGKPASPHSVKFKTEYCGIPINIDRPRGFIMKGTDSRGRDWARRYKYDYGFIPKTLGGDGDGLDVFIGPKKTGCPDAFWAVQRKEDGSFDEYKVFLGFENRDEAIAAYRQHIPKKYFKGIMAMRIEMMKSMLGKVNPNEKMKRASALAMADELGWLMRTMEKDAGLRRYGRIQKALQNVKFDKPGALARTDKLEAARARAVAKIKRSKSGERFQKRVDRYPWGTTLVGRKDVENLEKVRSQLGKT